MIVGAIVTNAVAVEARLENETAFPDYGEPIGLVGVARRIISELLDSGWPMPTEGPDHEQ